jgi:hypothetical protein
MINLSFNGQNANLVEENDLQWKMEAYFYGIFDKYLQQHYGIDTEQFKQILKNAAPEEFI